MLISFAILRHMFIHLQRYGLAAQQTTYLSLMYVGGAVLGTAAISWVL